ncbi:hypothetical protein [Larkinella sp. C7]|jgi:hypothetical protein|uniref:hypothetical protein n=1 Tax=Larkinella sp. C7 TaxID=2576607 RepID=UPI0011116018|nr:hypothetical protein [Larkinella sp. C7]
MTLFSALTTLVASPLLYLLGTGALGDNPGRRFFPCLPLKRQFRLKQQLRTNRFGATTMKINPHYRLALFATALFLSLSAFSFGQGRQLRQSTSPRQGFWVVESQPKQNCIVFFYNDDNQLIYKENLAKKRLNLKQAKTRESLNAVLEQALQQWAISQQPGGAAMPADQQWLATEFRK